MQQQELHVAALEHIRMCAHEQHVTASVCLHFTSQLQCVFTYSIVQRLYSQLVGKQIPSEEQGSVDFQKEQLVKAAAKRLILIVLDGG